MNGAGMINRTILYRVLKYAGIPLFLLLLLLPAKYINTVYGYLPFLFAGFLLLISVGGMFILRRSITVESDFNDVECIRGASVRVSMKVRNRSVFVCPRARAIVYISDLFGNADEEMEMDFAMAGRMVNDFSFDMDMLHIGSYHVGIRKLTIFDMTGLFQINVPVKDQFRVNVGPRIRNLEEIVISDDVMMESENDTRIASVGGMNYTGVREYEFGDSMKQIHWKLSAHSTTYMTKINEINRQNDYVVILDMAAPDYGTEELMDINDCLVETAVSLLERLAGKDVAFSVIFPDRSREIHRVMPSPGSYSEIVRDIDLLTPSPDIHYPDGAMLLENESSVSTRSANVIVFSSRITDTMIRLMLEIRQQNRTPELFCIFPERLTSRERETLEAPFEELGMAGIEYHMVSTAVNRSFENAPAAEPQYRRAPERRRTGNENNRTQRASSNQQQGKPAQGTRREQNKTDVRRQENRSRANSASRQKNAGRPSDPAGHRASKGASIRTNRTGSRPKPDDGQNGGDRP